MLKVEKVNIKKLYEDLELGNSRLEFNITGSNINYIIVNTIRRVIFTDIPTYAFTDFKFEKNTSVFHNNYLVLRLKYLPIWGIDNNINNINEVISKDINNIIEENLNEEINEEINEETNEIIQPIQYNTSSLKQFTMYVKYKNKTNDIITVTTNNAKFYYDNKQISSPYKSEIPIVKLQSNQEIAFSVLSSIGTEEKDTIYSAVSIVAYKEIDEKNFNFILESKGQINEKKILIVAIFNIKLLLNNLTIIINSLNLKKDVFQEGVLKLLDNDHTIGNLITDGLQKHKDVKFAGYNTPHPLEKIILLHYKINEENNIISVIDDVIKYYLVLFDTIKIEIEKNI